MVIVARCEASLETAWTASLPQAPCDSTRMGMHVHPSSKHLAPSAECFDPAVRPASERRDGFSGEVTERSKAAGLPQSQFEAKMSAGHVCRSSRPSPLPASALALMQARWQVWSTTSLSLLCLDTAQHHHLAYMTRHGDLRDALGTKHREVSQVRCLTLATT